MMMKEDFIVAYLLQQTSKDSFGKSEDDVKEMKEFVKEADTIYKFIVKRSLDQQLKQEDVITD